MRLLHAKINEKFRTNDLSGSLKNTVQNSTHPIVAISQSKSDKGLATMNKSL